MLKSILKKKIWDLQSPIHLLFPNEANIMSGTVSAVALIHVKYYLSLSLSLNRMQVTHISPLLQPSHDY
jgi:hypothetical protein